MSDAVVDTRDQLRGHRRAGHPAARTGWPGSVSPAAAVQQVSPVAGPVRCCSQRQATSKPRPYRSSTSANTLRRPAAVHAAGNASPALQAYRGQVPVAAMPFRRGQPRPWPRPNVTPTAVRPKRSAPATISRRAQRSPLTSFAHAVPSAVTSTGGGGPHSPAARLPVGQCRIDLPRLARVSSRRSRVRRAHVRPPGAVSLGSPVTTVREPTTGQAVQRGEGDNT